MLDAARPAEKPLKWQMCSQRKRDSQLSLFVVIERCVFMARNGRGLRSTIFVLMILLGSISVVAVTNDVNAAQAGDYSYTLAGSPAVATITGYNGTGGPISIPSTLDGYPTVAIGAFAFELKTMLTSVIVPDSVTSIGESAFSECSALTSVTIPDSVTSIGDWAFYECNALSSMTLSSNLLSIGNYSFAFCAALTTIDVDAGNPNYCSVDGILYNKTRTTLVQYPAAKTGSFTLPDSVTGLGGYAFCQSKLTSLTAGGNLKSIGDYAFFQFTSLTWASLPINVTSIGYGAFGYCTGLTSITIGPRVTSIGYYAFAECANLTAINVDAGNPNYYSVDGVLYNKMRTTLVICPGGIAGAFTIPDGIRSIETGAFYANAALTSISIPDGVSSIGGYAFAWCTALTSVTMPNSIISIGEGAFADCFALTNATIPSSATSIGALVFAYCPALTAITVESGNQNYCSVDGVLYNKTRTTLIQCPGGKEGTFTVSDVVTSIGDYAFASCANLTSVTIGSNVTSIGTFAFDRCANLISLSFLGMVAPTTVGASWIRDTPTDIRGHAYAASDLPPTGSSFNGLMMGAALAVVPGIPTNLSATPGNTVVALSWTAPVDDGGSAIDHYIIFRDGLDIARSATLNETVVGLINGQTYSFTVAAHNAVGTGPQSISNSSTPVTTPGAPTMVTATPGPGQVTVAWQAPASNGGSPITGYKVYLILNGGSRLLSNASASTFSHVDTTGTSGTNSTYFIVAVNAVGAGANSSQVSASPQSSDNTLIYVGIAIAIIAVIAIALVVMRRKK